MNSGNIWAVLIGLLLVYETITLLAPRRGDTLSEQVWMLMCNRLWRAALFGLWFWLTFHFIVEPFLLSDFTHSSGEDFLIVLLGFLVGWALPTSKFRGDCGEQDERVS